MRGYCKSARRPNPPGSSTARGSASNPAGRNRAPRPPYCGWHSLNLIASCGPLRPPRYQQVWELDRQNVAALYLSGQAIAASGNRSEADRRREMAELLALANEKKLYEMVSALSDRGLTAEANQQREKILRLGRFQSWELGSSLMNLGNKAYREKDYFRAADYYEKYMLGVLRTSSAFTRVRGYLILPHAIHKSRALGLLDKKQFDEAIAEATIAVSIMPGDTAFPLELIPAA